MQMKQFMFATALALGLGLSAQGAHYYVDGKVVKGGDGSATAPFATIQQAADVAQAGDTVFIKPGTYCETVKPKNSGKEGSPITFRNCPGEEKPTICGGDRVTGPWTKEGDNIYWAPCTWGMKVPGQNQVVVDGDLMIEARWPNIGGKEQLAPAKRVWKEIGGQGVLAQMMFNKDDVVVTNSPKWGTDFWKGGVVWGVGGWSARSALITGSQTSGDACRMTVSTNKTDWWNNFAGWPAPGFLTGVKGALDCEKEFFLDEAAGRLYLIPPGGVDPAGLTVYAKKRTTVIDLTGLTNVVFTQINTMMAGITLNNATGCALQNGRHLYSSHFYLMPNGRGDAVLGTTRDDPAGAALYVSGESNRIEGCEIAYAATGVRLDGRNHVVRNCVITDIYIGSYFGAIFIGDFYPVGGECGGHLIERNTMSRTGRGAVYWNEHKNAEPIKTTYTKCRVLYNHISDFMESTEDGGAIYAWVIDAGGTEVAYNWIHGERGDYHFNPALYSDDVTSKFRYHHNVIWDVKLGIGWNKILGKDEAYNNTIWCRSEAAFTMAWAGGGAGAPSGSKVFNNLSNKRFDVPPAAWGNEVTNNLMAGSGFAGNPEKPASGLDFRLAQGSPAIDAAMVISGITDGSVGKPDMGAYEFGGVAWVPGAGSEPVVPAAPIEFGATAMGAQGLRLGWTDVAFNEKAYLLERSTDGKNWTKLATLPANAFTYLDAGFHMQAGTAYHYRLAATNDYGASAWVIVKATTPQAEKAPAIKSPLAAKTMQGVFFTYTITAANDPAEVTVEGLPKGLALVTELDSSGGHQSFGAAAAREATKDWRPPVRSLAPGTALICGYPEEAGEAKVKITATNAKGADTKTLALTIAKAEPIVAPGATVTEYADAAGVRWTVLTFTNDGSFAVSGGPAEYLIVAGGGGGGVRTNGAPGGSGGGGAGGLLMGSVTLICGEHKVVVGAGGGAESNGEPSSVVGPSINWTALGGGRGSAWQKNGGDGGSGGGGGSGQIYSDNLRTSGGNSLYPLMFAGQQALAAKQGNKGGNGSGGAYRGAGGGGAGGVGDKGSGNGPGPAGGTGLSSTIQDGKTAVWYAGGGGGGDCGFGPIGGPGGSGIGGTGSSKGVPATDGKPNTGSGGGAGGGKGGSGIVIVRFVRTGK